MKKHGGGGGGGEQHALWGHLRLLVRGASKDSVEYVLQTLWRTRNTGLDSTDRTIIANMLHLPSPSHVLDPLLVCLRMLIRKCLCENCSKDDIQKLFPPEVSSELERLLTILLQKFLPEWREDITKEKSSLPHLKSMTWDIVGQNADSSKQAAIISMKLQSNTQSLSREKDVSFQLVDDKLEMMMKSMQDLREHLSSDDENLNGQQQSHEMIKS